MADAPARTWPALALDPRPGAPIPDDLDVRLALVLDDLDASAVEGGPVANWRVFFPTRGARDEACRVLRRDLGDWLSVEAVDVPDEGWAVKVQAELGPVRVGRLIIAPPWAMGMGSGLFSGSAQQEPAMGMGSGPATINPRASAWARSSGSTCAAGASSMPARALACWPSPRSCSARATSWVSTWTAMPWRPRAATPS